MGTRRWIGIVAATVVVAIVGAGCTPPSSPSPIGAQCSAPPVLIPGASLYNCNLAGLDLSGLDLHGVDLRGADLTGADLSGANLTSARLEGANLSGANLTGAQLVGAVLSGAILLGTLFVGANLLGAKFDFGKVKPAPGSSGGGGAGGHGGQPCGLYCAGYNEATVDTGRAICDEDYGVPFGQPDFRLHREPASLAGTGQRSVVTDAATDFSGATLGGDIFAVRGLSLAEADFTGATIRGALVGCRDLSGARFDGATVVATTWLDLDAAGLNAAGATFDGVAFCSVEFAGADLAGARFRGGSGAKCTDLGEDLRAARSALVIFDGSSLAGAEFGEPDLTGPRSEWVNHAWNGQPGASFSGADLSGVVATRASFADGVFTGAITTGFHSVADSDGVANDDRVDFSDADGWASATFTGPHTFNDAICPDGSVATGGASCF